MMTSGTGLPETVIELPEGARYFRTLLPADKAATLLGTCLQQLPWQQESIFLFGKQRLIPRLQCFLSEQPLQYRYSGKTFSASRMPAFMQELNNLINRLAGESFNSVLGNLYRDGNDAMGWHSDDETELGEKPAIASFSLGASRRFGLRHRQSGERIWLELEHNSLLLMPAGMQTHWQHCISKTRREVGPRINFSYRKIVQKP